MTLPDLHLLVGSYTATGGGNATGISIVGPGQSAGEATLVASTVAVLDDPSFLAVSGGPRVRRVGDDRRRGPRVPPVRVRSRAPVGCARRRGRAVPRPGRPVRGTRRHELRLGHGHRGVARGSGVLRGLRLRQ
ncbi:hypothetical protein DEJ15_05315 [Curtobacterium sp. MCJR17_043]|nr:hypothetical protein [Curtobacterium sp. MCJR17_043]WIB36545.1 hypothetical protein DEJ15_05315 [Curtobacterium sp. MCJR17_043]